MPAQGHKAQPGTGAALLTRDAFREGVFARDCRRCVLCGEPARDAHHIMERRLFDDGGYRLDNGASLCAAHHMACETTEVSVEQVREACNIMRAALPEHLYADERYDKWGNIVLPNGTRLRGELFHDESVQRALEQGGVLHLFTTKAKYPRTFHLPWSEGMHDDDRMLAGMSGFQGRRVIVTEKMDGECTSLYADAFHARSLDGRHHASRSWVKNFWGGIAADIPPAWRVCGENLFAKHSIGYAALPSFFMGFSVWDDRNACLPWDDTVEWLRLLGILPVPVLYDGVYDEAAIRRLYSASDWATREGYVLRLADGFSYGRFRHSVGKFVRRNHVGTTPHWMHGRPVEPNRLAKG